MSHVVTPGPPRPLCGKTVSHDAPEGCKTAMRDRPLLPNVHHIAGEYRGEPGPDIHQAQE